MLSFDITDRNIRIVKGTEGNGKIKITSAATLNLEEEVIINGHVKDIPRVATLINGIIKANKMADKEAIVSISSNLTIFKELIVTKVKGQDFQKAVKQQMQAELNLDDTYCVSYVIVGSADDDNEEPIAKEKGKDKEKDKEKDSKNTAAEQKLKVLATACPAEVVNCYRDVFKMLGITLKSVIIGCNCITKVLLADTKIKSRMPLLAVQIDNNFISLNLYEKGTLSFSRFASIDPSDYGNSNDYVFEAVNENIFRMLQFHRSRRTGETIENIILYGDTHDYVRLTDELGKMELTTSVINVPPQIHGHENLEFSLYANAIGAMFKRNKETEKINLLETEAAAAKGKGGADGTWPVGMLALLIGCAAAVGIVFGAMSIYDSSIKSDIASYQADIDSPETAEKLNLHSRLLTMQEKVGTYADSIQNAHDALRSQPVITGDKYDKLEEIIAATADECGVSEADIKSPQYSNGKFTFNVECTGVSEPTQKLPAKFVENLLADDEIATVSYSNYNVVEESGKTSEDGTVSGGGKKVTFSLTIEITGNENPYVAEESETEAE
jgi:type IV pilus assembly protein PilM